MYVYIRIYTHVYKCIERPQNAERVWGVGCRGQSSVAIALTYYVNSSEPSLLSLSLSLLLLLLSLLLLLLLQYIPLCNSSENTMKPIITRKKTRKNTRKLKHYTKHYPPLTKRGPKVSSSHQGQGVAYMLVDFTP